MFSKGPSFSILLFEGMGFAFAPARGSPATVSDLVLTSRGYIKLNLSGLDFLIPVLQSSKSFDLNAFFFKFPLV